MASSPIPEFAPLRAPQGVHLLMAVGIPTLFCGLAVFWTTGLGPLSAEFALTSLYTLLSAFWSPWRLRSHQGALIKLWVWSVVTLALYGALAALEGLPWPRTLAPEGNHILWFLAGVIQGQLAVLWAGQLASRARLFQLVAGVPEGRGLEERVRDFQLDADFSAANHTALAVTLGILSAAAVGLATFSSQGEGGLTAFLLAAFLTLCLLTGVLLRTYRREMVALMYGRRFTLTDKVTPLLWSLVLAVLAGLGAWALFALGGPWFDWSNLEIHMPQAVPPPPVRGQQTQPVNAPLLGGDFRLAVLVALLALIFRVHNIVVVIEALFTLASWAVPAALAAFLVWPLVRWVLSGGRDTRGLLRRWLALLAAQLRDFAAALKELWTGRSGPGAAGLSLGPSGAREWIRSFLGRPAPGRRPYPEVVAAFLALVRWAEPLTAYRRGETTREYLDRLAGLTPDRGADLALIRDLLDRELFGPRGLDPEGRRSFLDRVASVTRSPASQDGPTGVS